MKATRILCSFYKNDEPLSEKPDKVLVILSLILQVHLFEVDTTVTTHTWYKAKALLDQAGERMNNLQSKITLPKLKNCILKHAEDPLLIKTL